MSWSLRSWIIIALIAVPYFVLKEWFGIEYLSWVGWFMIGVMFLIGGAVLIRPDLASMRRPTLARLLGLVLVSAAALNAYFQSTQFVSE